MRRVINMKKVIIFILSIIIILLSGIIVNKVYLYYKDSQDYRNVREFKPIQEELNEEEDNFREDKLFNINSDYKFWISINDTEIDYPVVQGKDNDFYLKHNFNRKESISGCLFVDSNNNIDKDKNIVVYGHNMRNGTMFNNINKFKDEEVFLNNNIEIIKNKNKYTYEVFSVYVESVYDLDIRISFLTDKDYLDYLDILCKKSLYLKEIDIKETDDIITLITCSYEYNDARTVVHAIRRNISEKI